MVALAPFSRAIKYSVAPALVLSAAALSFTTFTRSTTLPKVLHRSMSESKTKSESEWRAVLSPEQASPIIRHPHTSGVRVAGI